MFSEEMFGIAIGFGLLVVVPLVAMLLHHQRKMAALIKGQGERPGVTDRERIARLEADVAYLTERVKDQPPPLDEPP